MTHAVNDAAGKATSDAASDVLLDIRDLNAFYGKSHVLHGVNLHVRKGEIVSLLGRNGVGRSTTVKAVMGQVALKGIIRFKGMDIAGLKPYEIARKGLGYVPENRDVFPTLSVEQNLLLGERPDRRSSRSCNDIYAMFPRLGERRDVPASVLSGGEQQLLTLCRTLMGDPDLILIDEPTEGLAPKVVAQVADFLKQLEAGGIAVLLVEQKLSIALEISRRVYVMGHGTIVFEGTPQELRVDAAMRKEWLEV